jgi:hypothetical protein
MLINTFKEIWKEIGLVNSCRNTNCLNIKKRFFYKNTSETSKPKKDKEFVIYIRKKNA